MRNTVPYYAKNIQTLVETIENVGEEMNPYFQKIRDSIDNHTIENLSKEELKKTYEVFTEGVEKYQSLLPMLSSVRPPAKILGMHKRLESVAKKYVDSCQQMTDAVHGTLNEEAFNESEKDQDRLTDDLAFCVQRISTLIGGK